MRTNCPVQTDRQTVTFEYTNAYFHDHSTIKIYGVKANSSTLLLKEPRCLYGANTNFRSNKCKRKHSSRYLELIGAAGSLLFDACPHVFLHLIQDTVEGVKLRLQILLDSVGVCLVSNDNMREWVPTLYQTSMFNPDGCTSRFSRLCFSVQTKFEISSFFKASVWVILRRDS